MLRVIRIGQFVTVITFDTIGVPGGQAGTVGRCRPAGKPAGRAMTADTHITDTIKVLFRDRHRGPENRVTTRVGHHTAAPVMCGLYGTIVATVTVITFVR